MLYGLPNYRHRRHHDSALVHEDLPSAGHALSDRPSSPPPPPPTAPSMRNLLRFFPPLSGLICNLLYVLLLFRALSAAPQPAHASVTVYSAPLLGESTQTAAAASYTAAAAYDNTTLTPPTPPTGQTTAFTLTLQESNSSVTNISIPQQGSFLGFSIEFSVINQVLGINASYLQVPFLNLMGNLKSRVNEIHIRVGGNSQETATLVDSLPNNTMIEKDKADSSNPTETPTLIYTPEVLYMLSNITALVGVKWYLGIPFNDTTNLRLGIAEYGEAILGSNLLGFQVGNEPDLYADHNHRPANYSPSDYFNEFGVVVQGMENDTNIAVRPPNNLIAPSVATGDWTPEMVWNTGFIPAYSANLGALAVEHYPNDNCYAQYGIGSYQDPEQVFPTYLVHNASTSLVAPYLNSTSIAQQAGKPFLMFETNTASCGGFPGISDSFGSTLWAVDYALQMAYSNFSGALLHVGGQDDYYNPFTPPPTNQSTFHQWSVGPIFYSTLVVAEALGSTGTAQVYDLQANSGSLYTPAYVIYENGAPARVALINFITDPTGANDIEVTINVPNAPSSVDVKYLIAPSVSEKSNITWAGQTFGSNLASDGRLQNSESVQTISCDQSASTCTVPLQAPGVALVFLTSTAYKEVNPSTTETFSTTAWTKTGEATVTVNPSVLATSNGHSGSSYHLSSTSDEKISGAAPVGAMRSGHGAWGSVVAAFGAATLSSAVLWLVSIA